MVNGNGEETNNIIKGDINKIIVQVQVKAKEVSDIIIYILIYSSNILLVEDIFKTKKEDKYSYDIFYIIYNI